MLLVCSTDALAAIVKEQAKETADLQGVPLEVDATVLGAYYYRATPDEDPEKLMLRFATYEFLLEYERSARYPNAVNRKLREYVAHAKWGVKKRLAFVTETDRVEAIAIDQARQLLNEYEVSMEIVTSTRQKITERLPAGDREVWTCVRYASGHRLTRGGCRWLCSFRPFSGRIS